MIKITNKIGFEDRCWVGLVDSSTFNRSEEDRIKAVTDMASITKGRLEYKDPKLVGVSHVTLNQEKLYNKLLKESADKPSVPFEFVPCTIHTGDTRHEYDEIQWIKYGTFTEGGLLYSNLRNELNNKYTRGYNKHKSDVNGFKIIVGRIPIKVVSHLRTHRAFSFLVESSRNRKYLNEVKFWYPSWWNELQVLASSRRDESRIQNVLGDISSKMTTPEEATMELSDRRLVTFAMAAWKQDTNAWNNLFAVRGEGTGTQNITRVTVDNIKKLIND